MATDVLEVLEDAIALDEIQAASEAFMTSKLSLFEGIDVDKALESQEQQLEWHAAYREYVSLMEERILSACAEDLTKEEVLVQLTSLLENDEDRFVQKVGSCFDAKRTRFLSSNTLQGRSQTCSVPVKHVRVHQLFEYDEGRDASCRVSEPTMSL
eukprot:g13081.t1